MIFKHPSDNHQLKTLDFSFYFKIKVIVRLKIIFILAIINIEPNHEINFMNHFDHFDYLFIFKMALLKSFIIIKLPYSYINHYFK